MITPGYKEAVATGAKHYIGGPCQHGNTALRRVSDRKCICEACTSSKTKRSKARKQHWGQANKEKLSERARDWRKNNPARCLETKRKWRDMNRAQKIAWDQDRRAKKLRATPSWVGEFDAFVLREAARLCRMREVATGIPWQIDHIIPLQALEACGLHCAANFQVIPASMNSAKRNSMTLTTPGEWIRFA